MAIEREGLTNFVRSLAECDTKERTQILEALNQVDYDEIRQMDSEELDQIISKRGFFGGGGSANF